MIELLSKLDPATSPYVGQMQDSGKKLLTEEQLELRKAAKNTQCERCRGRKQIKEARDVLDETGVIKLDDNDKPVIERVWVTCPRCFGSGKKMDGAHVSTASRNAPSTLSHDLIANLVQGMRPECYRAAVVAVTRNQAMQRILIDDVRVNIALNLSHEWRLSDDLRKARCLGLSRVAVHNLVNGGYARTNEGSILMCCTAQGWRKTWAERAAHVTDRLQGWVVAADGYMYDQLIESVEEFAEP